MTEDSKRFYVVATQLDPLTKMLSFCDNKYFPSSSVEIRCPIQPTEGEVNDEDGATQHRSDLDDLLGVSTTSMDLDQSSIDS